MKLNPFLIPLIKINWQYSKELNVRLETIKLLEEYTQKNLPDIGLGNDFLVLTTKARATKAKINKWNYMKLKSFYIAKETMNKMKRQPTELEK